MVESDVGEPRGVLNLKAGTEKFQLSLHAPDSELAFFVEHFWRVRWDLRGQEPYRQETLPHPAVHLVFEKGNTRVVGVMTRKFAYLLQDRGQVFGVKFRPGAFYPFVQRPVSSFTDGVLSLQDVFGVDGAALEAAVLAQEDAAALVDLAGSLLRQRLPEQDENVAMINEIVAHAIADRTLTKVEDLAARFALSKRTLQRLFSQYVGASPKWVIRRYRLQDAADRLAGGAGWGDVDWSQMALDLGYFDLAHFIKDFKATMGLSPAAYARQIRESRPPEPEMER